MISRIVTFNAVPPDGDEQERQQFYQMPDEPRDLSIFKARRQLEQNGYEEISFESAKIEEHSDYD